MFSVDFSRVLTSKSSRDGLQQTLWRAAGEARSRGKLLLGPGAGKGRSGEQGGEVGGWAEGAAGVASTHLLEAIEPREWATIARPRGGAVYYGRR